MCDIGFGGKVGRKEQGRPDRVETKEGGREREREGNLIYSNEMREVFCAPVYETPTATVTGGATPLPCPIDGAPSRLARSKMPPWKCCYVTYSLHRLQ